MTRDLLQPEDWLSQTITVPQLVLALVASLTILVLAFKLNRWYREWRLRLRWSQARAAEAEAPSLLRELGYKVLGAQVEGSYSLIVDGQPLLVPLRADYVVARDGLTYVAEVKSGRLAPRLGTAATRRQLLEYLIAYPVDGVLLVDGETRRVHRVVFPLPHQKHAESSARGVLFVAISLVLVIAALATYLAFR